jgi:hypothetical protein
LYAAISNLSEFEIFEPDDKNTILCILLKGSSCKQLIYLVMVGQITRRNRQAVTLDAFILNATTWALSEIKGHKHKSRKVIFGG